MTVQFPDGRKLVATVIALDRRVDLAILAARGARKLPFATIAKRAPAVGTWVTAIGQPGRFTPRKRPTGYTPFHVSVGKIRGFLPNRLVNTPLGATKHDAWTYWGHSGSPLFDRQGRLVALHNTWDSTTAMRHAVSWEGIASFLRNHRIPHLSR